MVGCGLATLFLEGEKNTALIARDIDWQDPNHAMVSRPDYRPRNNEVCIACHCLLLDRQLVTIAGLEVSHHDSSGVGLLAV
ncbi:hypothetical protein BaRGS_00016405, partial [Batillaria attramentaria]